MGFRVAFDANFPWIWGFCKNVPGYRLKSRGKNEKIAKTLDLMSILAPKALLKNLNLKKKSRVFLKSRVQGHVKDWPDSTTRHDADWRVDDQERKENVTGKPHAPAGTSTTTNCTSKKADTLPEAPVARQRASGQETQARPIWKTCQKDCQAS